LSSKGDFLGENSKSIDLHLYNHIPKLSSKDDFEVEIINL
jgi:hypothetical protein